MRHNDTATSHFLGWRTSVAGMAAIGLITSSVAGCNQHASRPIALKTPSLSTTAAPIVAPLPPPEALVDVLTRLSDPDLPSAEKVVLVQTATDDSIPLLDKYSNALHDSGYLPMRFTADHVAWCEQTPGDVTANVTVTSANKRVFTFPMEFTPYQAGWQLSRKTADMLLAFSESSSTTPTDTSAQSSPSSATPSG